MQLDYKVSDRKLKDNIKDASNQWADIKKLKLRKYNLKEAPGKKHIGLIAQEVEQVSPGLVGDSVRPGHGDMVKHVNYSLLNLKMLGALQEAMKRIEELEAKVG